ncbi:hypothetical protein AVEN_157849-1 [Araneus ventricosus]|uniref:Uncharacterized protein n=1 Tax=Araneus ventricosus TaxID=182803 RepID=A0A4Y2E766_ARAVE|nr:hypothetical protein AVEN_157849-1 [Araneus ventricosus]
MFVQSPHQFIFERRTVKERLQLIFNMKQDDPAEQQTVSFSAFKYDLLEKPDIEDLERSVVLMKPSLELEPTTFCNASVISFTSRSTAWE